MQLANPLGKSMAKYSVVLNKWAIEASSCQIYWFGDPFQIEMPVSIHKGPQIN